MTRAQCIVSIIQVKGNCNSNNTSSFCGKKCPIYIQCQQVARVAMREGNDTQLFYKLKYNLALGLANKELTPEELFEEIL